MPNNDARDTVVVVIGGGIICEEETEVIIVDVTGLLVAVVSVNNIVWIVVPTNVARGDFVDVIVALVNSVEEVGERGVEDTGLVTVPVRLVDVTSVV